MPYETSRVVDLFPHELLSKYLLTIVLTIIITEIYWIFYPRENPMCFYTYLLMLMIIILQSRFSY